MTERPATWRPLCPGIFEGVPHPPVDPDTLAMRIRLSSLPLTTRASHRFSTWNPRAELQLAFDAVYEFIRGNRKHHFLTLAGPPGTGKTHLALSAAWSWLEEGLGNCSYYHVETLLDELRAGYNRQANQPTEETALILNYVSRCGLTVLDDLGAEAVTEWAWSKLDSIVDYRYVHRLPLIVTTNVSPEKLAPRIADRLFEGQVVILKAESYRRREQKQ